MNIIADNTELFSETCPRKWSALCENNYRTVSVFNWTEERTNIEKILCKNQAKEWKLFSHSNKQIELPKPLEYVSHKYCG